ncbi:MAG: TonB-dependent receptor [bacterium]|nr:TonB-dependent receptor [bacterium]
MLLKKVRLLSAAATVLFLCASVPGNADEDIEVVVTATRIEQSLAELPVTANVVTAEEIVASQARNVGEALELMPGVSVGRYGALGASSTVKVRGATSAQVLVMLDGRPLNTAQSGEVDLTDIPVADVERIELLRGPASSLYGAYALGGVVNIITKKGGGPAVTELSSAAGSLGFSDYSLSHSGGDGKLGYTFNVNKISSDGFRPNSAYDADSYSARADLTLDRDSSLTVSLRKYNGTKGVPGSETWLTPYATQWNDNSYLSLRYDRGLADGKVSADLYLHQDSIHYHDDDPFWPTDTSHDNDTLGLMLQRDGVIGAWRTVYGLDWRRDNIDSLTIGSHDAVTGAAYIQGERRLSDRLTLIAGGRYDSHSIYGSQFSPRLGTAYRLGGGLIRASFGQGFRPPVFQDLYWNEPPYMMGNPDLQPERSTAYEVGFEREMLGTEARFTLFRQDVDNLIRWGDNGAGVWTPMNIDQARLQGMEVELSRELRSGLKGFVSYTRLDAKNIVDDSRLPYSPENSLAAGLRFAFRQGLSGALSARMVDKQITAAGSSDTIPAYTSVDLQLSQQLFGNAGLVLAIDNLLNADYYERKGYPMPGRTVNVRLKWGF